MIALVVHAKDDQVDSGHLQMRYFRLPSLFGETNFITPGIIRVTSRRGTF